MQSSLSRQLRRSALGACLAAASSGCAFALNPADTSVQMFEWSWNDLASECTQFLGPQGYGGIQISPPGASKTTATWWGVYQPVNYVNLTSRFGTQAQLQSMINTCHAAGVRVYADVVVNQMAADSSSTAGVATDGSTWNSATLSYPYFSASDFHAACDIQSADYNSAAGRSNVQACRLSGMPDLNSESSYVRGQIVNYLNALLALGIDGFRIDAAKHQAAASLQAIMSSVKSTHPTTNQGEAIWVTQEIVPDGEVVRSDYFPIGTVNEFQFAYAMRDAFRNANGASPSTIPTMMGTWNNWGGTWGFVQPTNATVFVNNWDTERNGGSLAASNYTGATNDTQGSHRYDLANIFMLAQGYGEAQLHSGFRFTNVDQDRPGASPYVNGVAQVNVNWDFVHRWGDIAPMVKFRSAAHGQAQTNWVTGNANQIAFGRGNVGFVALNNSTAAWSRSFYTGLPAGTYCNVVHGLKNAGGTACTSDSVTVDASGNATITVPADGGATVPAVAIYTGQTVSGGGGATCAVTFTISNANTVMGQNLYVVGNQAALGNWTPASGFALTIQGSGANVPWTGTISLPAATAMQYKYVKWNGSTAVWESNQATSSGNREFTSCAAGSSVARNDGSFKN
ncbi:MAG: alpha amylase C-terminal domain-containing protein [Burkholderiales bacterium]|nr:alpha amylase C-terminal domain-containing protein [Burkholderiales bacterium]